jgi:tetratricopeptide (TPR) repeat protein
MNRPASSYLAASCLAIIFSGLAFSQTPSAPLAQTPSDSRAADKASAYYNFAMGHLYAELAGAFGNRSDYTNKAIDFYRQAMKLDPAASFLSEELTDLYIQAGRIKDAVTEAEDLLKQNPENTDARRLLGRIYARLIGDPQQNKVNEDMVRRAIEQFQKVTEKEPKDIESWLMLGRLERVSRNSVEAEKAFKKVLDEDASNEEALTGLAMVYSEIGDNKNAIEMLRLVTSKNPNPRTLSALASFYEQSRDYVSAAEVWRQALQMDPENARIKRALAQDVLFTDRFDEALKLYTEIAAADPRDTQVQLRISEIYRQKGDFAKARAAFAKAKELDRDSLEVRYDEVNLLEAEGKTDEAILALKAIITDTAKKAYTESEKNSRTMLLQRLGMLYRTASRYNEAVEAFRQIPQVDANIAPRASVEVVDTWRMAKDFTRALEEAQSALKKFPNDRTVKLAHASLLSDMGKIDESAAELRALLGGDKDRETHLVIAQIFEKGKRYADMAAELDEAEKLSQSKPDKQTVFFMRGAMFEKQKKYDEAEAEFRKVLAVDPDNAGALNYLGYMLADRNVRLDEAQKMIGKAVELEPQNGAYLDSLGWVYFRQNRLDEAADYLQRALRRFSKDPTIHDHLGDVYFKQGKIREAIAQWQNSLKEWEATSQTEIDHAEVAKINRKLESARVRMANLEKDKQH